MALLTLNNVAEMEKPDNIIAIASVLFRAEQNLATIYTQTAFHRFLALSVKQTSQPPIASPLF